MEYREHPVPRPLSPIVDVIWTLAGPARPAADDPAPILPDGRAELVVHFGEPFEKIDRGVASRQAGLIVAGQLEAPLLLRPTGRVAVMGIRLRPAGAAALMQLPQHELVGQTVEAHAISPPLADWLGEVRDRARSLDHAVAIVGGGLQRLARHDRIDRRVAQTTDLIDRVACTRTVEQIAGSVGLTRRQLERLFRDRVGVSPKQLMRIRRLQRALRALEDADPECPVATAAVESGYADQSHFVRDCRRLAGRTPTAHLLQRAELTGLFQDRR